MQNSFPPRYPVELERQMRQFYQELSAQNQRLYAAVEAEKFPDNGIGYVAGILDCDPEIISRGIEELCAAQSKESEERISTLEE